MSEIETWPKQQGANRPNGSLSVARAWTADLQRVDAELAPDLANLPRLLRPVPLAVWGEALLHPEQSFPRSHQYLPVMPTDQVQDQWTGGHGAGLLLRSLDFITQVVAWLGLSEINAASARGMDFGIGWGRLARLWLKYAPPEALTGADAWPVALELARSCRLANPLLRTDEVLGSPPAEGLDFAWAYSVFTHLDRVAFSAGLAGLAGSLRAGGALIFTVLPHEYWAQKGEAVPSPEQPFVHRPIDGHDHFGWTSVSRAWVADECQRVGLAAPRFEWSPSAAYQVIVLTGRA